MEFLVVVLSLRFFAFCLRLRFFYIFLCCRRGEIPQNQKIPRISVGDVFYVPFLAKFNNVFEQYDFHFQLFKISTARSITWSLPVFVSSLAVLTSMSGVSPPSEIDWLFGVSHLAMVTFREVFAVSGTNS